MPNVQQRLPAIQNQRSFQKSAISPKISHLTRSAIIWFDRRSAKTAINPKSVILPGISDLTRNQPSIQKCHHLACSMFRKDCQRSKIRDLARNQPSRQKSAISPDVPLPGLPDIQQRLPVIQNQRSHRESAGSPKISHLTRSAITLHARCSEKLPAIQNQRSCQKSAILPEFSYLTRSAIFWFA